MYLRIHLKIDSNLIFHGVPEEMSEELRDGAVLHVLTGGVGQGGEAPPPPEVLAGGGGGFALQANAAQRHKETGHIRPLSNLKLCFNNLNNLKLCFSNLSNLKLCFSNLKLMYLFPRICIYFPGSLIL